MARVLGAIRQSKTRDRAVSPETQRSAITHWAGANGHTVAKITEDLSRSGKTSAFKRPGLGPYLTNPERIASWDILVSTKLDRACRNTADYLKLRDWCAANGKRLVLLNNPELDESKPAGKAMGTITAAFAEFERDMASERRTETLAELAEQGRWSGGRPPYGFRADKREDGFYLVPDVGGTADVANTMADMAIQGQSNGQIRAWLNANGHKNAAGNPWSIERVRLVLRSAAMAELLGDAKHAKLRAALRSRSQTRGERVGGHMLLRVAFCRTCGSPLYAHIRRTRPSKGYYRCLPCGYYIPIAKLEAFTEVAILDAVGERQLTRRELVPGDDYAKAIAKLESDIETLQGIEGTETLVETKQAEIERLSALPHQPDRYVPVPTGQTVAEHWATLTESESRRRFLREWGVTVKADRNGAELETGWLAMDEPDTFPIS